MERLILSVVFAALVETCGSKRLESQTASQPRTLTSSGTLAFEDCETGKCPTSNPSPTFPTIMCAPPKQKKFARAHEQIEGQIQAFISFAHGGDPTEEHGSVRPLILGMQNFLCPRSFGGTYLDTSTSIPSPEIFISVAYASAESTCFQMKLPSRPVICGCLDNAAYGKEYSVVTDSWVTSLPETCEYLITKPRPMAHLYADRSVPPAPTNKSTLCAVSWNVGREFDKHVPWLQGLVDVGGVGLSGLKGDELSHGLEMLVRECGDASIVVLGLQEGAEHRLTQRIQALRSKGSRRVRANSFAGVRPWGNNIKAIGDVQGFSQHLAYVIKEGIMIKYGQKLGAAHERMIVLTSENLLTFELDAEKQDIPIGSPTNALELGTPEFKVEESASSLCIKVTGMQLVEAGKGENRCDIVSYTMCADKLSEYNSWLASIQLSHWRAGGFVMREGVLDLVNPKTGTREPHLVVVTNDRLTPFSFNLETDGLVRGAHAIQLGLSEFRAATTLDPLCMTVTGQELAYTYDGIRTGKIILYKLCAKSEAEIDEWVTTLQSTALASAVWETPEEYVVHEGQVVKHGQMLGREKNRFVRLTSQRLLTNDVDNKTGEPVGPPTNSLELASITIEPEESDSLCMYVTGLEKGRKVKFKMCVAHETQRRAWVRAVISERDHPRQVSSTISDRIPKDDLSSLTVRLNLILESTEDLFANESATEVIISGVAAAITGIAVDNQVEILSTTKTCLHGHDAWAMNVAVHAVDLISNQDLKEHMSRELGTRGVKVLDAQMSVISQERGPVRTSKTRGDKVHSLPFTKGVSLTVLSDIEPSEVELFTVDFSFASKNRRSPNTQWLPYLKKQFRDKMLPTTADKGGAIVRVVYGSKALCFAACHLDAGNAKKRHQQAQLMADSLSALPCDAQLWMGDFNTRPTGCCPWKEMELSIAHGLYRHVRQLTWNHDDFPSMSEGYEEMPPISRPTFHKRFKRQDQDECADSHEFVDFDQDRPPVFQRASLTKRVDIKQASGGGDIVNASSITTAEHAALNAIKAAQDAASQASLMVAAAEAAIEAAKAEESYKSTLFAMNQFPLQPVDGECGSPSQHTVCWQGHKTKEMCEAGACFNILDKSHCPGYTDRVVYKPGSILEPLAYYSVESRVEADHTPVIATFALNFD